MRSTPIKVLLPCLALALASSGTARGGLVLQAQEDSGPILTINMPGNGQTISLVGSYSQLPDFTFVGFGETSNSPGSTAGQLVGTVRFSRSIRATACRWCSTMTGSVCPLAPAIL